MSVLYNSWITIFLSVLVQPMDLSWNPFSCGGLFMSAPRLVEKLRGQQCPLSRQFLTALSLCHTVMAELKQGCVSVCVWLCVLRFCESDESSSVLIPHPIRLFNLSSVCREQWFVFVTHFLQNYHIALFDLIGAQHLNMTYLSQLFSDRLITGLNWT